MDPDWSSLFADFNSMVSYPGKAESKMDPDWSSLFADFISNLPWQSLEQRAGSCSRYWLPPRSAMRNVQLTYHSGGVNFNFQVQSFVHLKGLSHEIDFKNVDENGQILTLTRAAAGF
jgi:hypothetical protein